MRKNGTLSLPDVAWPAALVASLCSVPPGRAQREPQGYTDLTRSQRALVMVKAMLTCFELWHIFKFNNKFSSLPRAAMRFARAGLPLRGYHARMARRAQHLRCSLCERSERAQHLRCSLCERSERADNKLDNFAAVGQSQTKFGK